MHDILCLGNALIDCFLSLSHPDQHARVDPSTATVAFPLGAKVPVDHVTFSLGGNACNVSVGLSRLGKKVGLIAEIGNDMFAGIIKDGLHKEQVETHLLEQTTGPSSFAVSIKTGEDRVLFVEHVLREHKFRFADCAGKWMYITSLGNKWHSAYEEALAFAKKHDIRIAFNPGTPQFEEGVTSFQAMLKATDILFVNTEEAQRILMTHAIERKACLLKLQALGPKVVVVTDGKDGSYAIDQSGIVQEQTILESDVVERTGAGDAFIAGFLASYVDTHELQRAMQWGTVNAAAVIGKIGSQPGLLTRQELERQVVAIV